MDSAPRLDGCKVSNIQCMPSYASTDFVFACCIFLAMCHVSLHGSFILTTVPILNAMSSSFSELTSDPWSRSWDLDARLSTCRGERVSLCFTVDRKTFPDRHVTDGVPTGRSKTVGERRTDLNVLHHTMLQNLRDDFIVIAGTKLIL